MTRITEDFLTYGYRREPDEFHAKFDSAGNLTHFGYYQEGRCDKHWALTLEPGRERGRLELKLGPPGGAVEIYRDGRAERRDAWSDNIPPAEVGFEDWVREAIARIYNIRPLRCGFCGVLHGHARLVGDVDVGYICEPCLVRLGEQLAGAVPGEVLELTSCSFCGVDTRVVQSAVPYHPLAPDDRLTICADCVAYSNECLEEGEEPPPGT